MTNNEKGGQNRTFVLIGIAIVLLPAFCRAQYTISTVAGNGTMGYAGDGGPATSAELSFPNSVAVDSNGNLYIADTNNSLVRKVTPDGTISIAAGNPNGGYYSGGGVPAASSALDHPYGVAVDASGNLYIADGSPDNAVLEVSASTGMISTVAGDSAAGGGYSGDGGPATSAGLNLPMSVAVDSGGNIYIVDENNNRIRKVSASTGVITTVAGNGTGGYSGDGGAATSAELADPTAVAVDGAGNLYIADTNNFRIREVSASTGMITTVAGNGNLGDSGDGGPATSASFGQVEGVAVDASGNLYITDEGNNVIREVTNGAIARIAGNGGFGYTGDGGPATSAELFQPEQIAVSATGKVYIADLQNNVIRLLTPSSPVTMQPPSIKPGGVVSAGAYGAFSAAAPGSWIEIYGSNLAAGSRSWAGTDFKGENAPTSLDKTSVSIGGQAAFVDYISPGQVNAQVPSGVGAGPQSLIVTTAAGASASYTITINQTEPGLLAPPSFTIGGKQYVGAVFPSNNSTITYVLPPEVIAGVTSQRAKPGDTIILYGIGFGPVSPNIPPGQIVQASNSLTGSLQISFAGVPATLKYDGLAPSYVGLYQFNLVVPNVAASDTVPVTFTLNGAAGTQTLYIPVQN